MAAPEVAVARSPTKTQGDDDELDIMGRPRSGTAAPVLSKRTLCRLPPGRVFGPNAMVNAMTRLAHSLALLVLTSACGGAATNAIDDRDREQDVDESTTGSRNGDSFANEGAQVQLSPPALISLGGAHALGLEECGPVLEKFRQPAYVDTVLPLCGNGQLDPDEVCDDGTSEYDGGCWDNCLGVDENYICPCPGQPCFIYSADADPTCEADSTNLCTSECGNGTVEPGEQCDSGDRNIGGYNRCSPDCTLVEFCGDGIVQENEFCDDAMPDAPTNCTNCRVITLL